MTCFVFLYAAFFRQGGYKEVEFQTSIIGFAQLSQFRMLVISARFPGAEQGPPYFSLLCNVPSSSSPLISSILQRFLCALRGGLLIHLVFLPPALCPHTRQKKECSVQAAAPSQLTSLLSAVYPSKREPC